MSGHFPSWGEGQDEVYIHPHPCTGTPYIAWAASLYSSPEEVRDYANRLLAAAEWVEEWDRKQVG